MGNIALSVEGLGKRYRIGQRKAAYSTLREKLNGVASGLFRRNGADAERGPRDFWALKDVSFEIKHGEVVGVIGRNGAGKSTLLKVLSRITEPTEGRARVYGRVGSLLEVGTGFHPELTGRENIYLNGAILGMSKADINRKFDEIVDFAEVEQFLDTPVKRYSSGMQLRLGFAVAAHLEPDILIVDEVLAVGDATFQRKCLGKMQDVAHGGRTVLLVSHNMTAIERLSSRSCFIDAGSLSFLGKTSTAIERYLHPELTDTQSASVGSDSLKKIGNPDRIRFLDLQVSQNENHSCKFQTHLPVNIKITYNLLQAHRGLRVGVDLYDAEGTFLFRSFHDDDPAKVTEIQESGRYTLTTSIPPNLLKRGKYRIQLTATIHMIEWITIDQVGLSFEMSHTNGVNSTYFDGRPGLIMPLLEWNVHVASA